MLYTYGYMFYIPVNSIYAAITLLYGLRTKKSYPYYFFAVVMAVYINLAINLVYFPIISIEEIEWELKNYIDISLNFSKMGGSYQIFGNVLLTVPVGILFPFISGLKKWKSRLCVIGISCAVELIQFLVICLVHSVTLFFDIKDMILNAIGGILGILFFEIFAKVMLIRKRPGKKSGFWSYIYDQCAEVKSDTQIQQR